MEDLVVDFDRWRPTGQRAQVLRVAARLWGRHGYEFVSLRRISAEVGQPLAATLVAFRCKRELFDCLLAEIGTAFEVARRRLVAAQRSQSASLTIEQLATNLAEPIEQLNREGEHGRNLLALWRLHCPSSSGDMSVLVRKASAALIDAAATVLVRQDAKRSHEAMLKACGCALADAIQSLGATTKPGVAQRVAGGENPMVAEIARQIRLRCAGLVQLNRTVSS